MEQVCQTVCQNATARKQYSRREVIGQVISFETFKEKFGISQRTFARMTGIPRTTLQQWIARKAAINAPPALVELVESPDGLALLHRIVMAALFVITQLAPGSIRMCCTFFVLSGLNEFVVSSYGSVQKVVKVKVRQASHEVDLPAPPVKTLPQWKAR